MKTPDCPSKFCQYGGFFTSLWCSKSFWAHYCPLRPDTRKHPLKVVENHSYNGCCSPNSHKGQQWAHSTPENVNEDVNSCGSKYNDVHQKATHPVDMRGFTTCTNSLTKRANSKLNPSTVRELHSNDPQIYFTVGFSSSITLQMFLEFAVMDVVC